MAEGEVLGNRYRLTQILGQGGMSRVYLAEDTRLGVQVAVKESLQTSSEARAQFRQEAQILARLSHPNLPRVTGHFVDTASGRQYLVMEYVEGEDLATMIARRGSLPEKMALAWVRQVLDALEYLHRQSPPIIHRDVKPGNIKITPEGKAVLVDFGIAKVCEPGTPTLTGAKAVTPGYAPPEQYGMRTSERSDIYALGATLYTMLTGRLPPEAPLRVAGESDLVPPRSLVPTISPVVEAGILKTLELQTSRRCQSMAELWRMLEGRPAERLPRPRPRSGEGGRVPLYVGLALVAALIFLRVLLAGGGNKPTPTPIFTAGPTQVIAMATITRSPTKTPTRAPTETPALVPSRPVLTAKSRPASPTPTRTLTATRTPASLKSTLMPTLGGLPQAYLLKRVIDRAANKTFLAPFDVALDSEGNVYLSDQERHRVVKFSHDGDFLLQIAPGWGTEPGKLSYPSGIGVDASGRIFVAERENHRVSVFSLRAISLCLWTARH